jgi:hypothetical protein
MCAVTAVTHPKLMASTSVGCLRNLLQRCPIELDAVPSGSKEGGPEERCRSRNQIPSAAPFLFRAHRCLSTKKNYGTSDRPKHASDAYAVPWSRKSRFFRGHLPTNGRTRTRDSVNSLTSSCPVWSVSNLSNSASINLSHSSLETLPLLSVSIASNSCLAAWAASSAASSVVAAAWRWSHYCRFLALGLCGIHCHNSG